MAEANGHLFDSVVVLSKSDEEGGEDAEDQPVRSQMMTSIEEANLDCLRRLLERDKFKPTLSLGDKGDALLLLSLTSFKHATLSVQAEMTLMILQSGCDAAFADRRGQTAVHNAACFGRSQMLAVLLQSGAHRVVDLQTSRGVTSLHLACIWDRRECVRLLVEHGADLTIVDEDDETPFDNAFSNGHERICNYLGVQVPQRISSCKAAVLCLLMIWKFRSPLCGPFGQLQKDVVQWIARMLWDSRRRVEWASKEVMITESIISLT